MKDTNQLALQMVERQRDLATATALHAIRNARIVLDELERGVRENSMTAGRVGTAARYAAEALAAADRAAALTEALAYMTPEVD